MRVGEHNPVSESENNEILEIGKKVIIKSYGEPFLEKIENYPYKIDIKRQLDNEYEYRIHFTIDDKPIYIWINKLDKSFWFEPLFYRKTKLTPNKDKKIIGLISEL